MSPVDILLEVKDDCACITVPIALVQLIADI